jgi:hypothetical protein
MSDNNHSIPSASPLDELAAALLSCGAVLSQMIAGMVEFERSGRSAPDAAPIPDVAHSLVVDVLDGVRRRHSRRDIRMAAAIIAEATNAICSDIFVLDPSFFDSSAEEGRGSAGSDG